MKLIVHNLLQCNIKNIEDGYPLQIISNEIQIILEEYNPGNLNYFISLFLFNFSFIYLLIY